MFPLPQPGKRPPLAGVLVLLAGLGLFGAQHSSAQTTTQAGRATLLDAERAFWQSIDQASPVELNLYLERFPAGLYASLAKRRLLDIEELARRAKTEADVAQRLAAEQDARRRAEEAAEREAEVRRKSVEAENRRQAEEAAAKLAAARKARNIPAGAFEFEVGQMWAYEIRDAFTKLLIRRVYWEVTATDENSVSMGNNRSVSWDGRIFKARDINFEPFWRLLDYPLDQGKRWRSQHTANLSGGLRKQWDINYRVVGRETLRLSLGTFDCVKIEAEGAFTSRTGTGNLTATYWYSQKVGQFVRVETTERNSGNPAPYIHEYGELVGFKLPGGQ